MSERERDEHSGVETTGHEWDGLKELDNPLPRWWLWIFYGCIAFAVVYWVLMPAWPGLNGYTPGVLKRSDRAEVVQQLSALQAQRGRSEGLLVTASLQQIEADPDLQAHALAIGQSVFGDNCASCHGVGGGGAKGYPNLRDDVWLWGGTLEEIEHTLRVGVRSAHPETRVSQMPAFGRDGMLDAGQVSDLSNYVVALSGREANPAAVERARQLFADNCAACHAPNGVGNRELGAPNLTDREWLYGSDLASIQSQIHNGRNGVMPTWEGRFSPAVIKALAVYVHVNAGGGETSGAPATAP
ncbi:MAG: cytochrome-c oxidase, cbb3-type subunit III [Alphaproteobacteria bacterium]|jgi:cytochrome c oxidase cbb3-type subunit 3|uniref:cytochrome-c oxidase, cbb3-type subunit III n=1 Tax=Brevundimonas sp. TaxID=1871086 RepID=UPI0012136A8D|nr:cytochrome-c oxidase, cbb3-type subunit III [Brevundimonas sp.]MBU3970979.1 cytochrome-c oxidase, cbb3-type subunit III [Alphaproteobacteria bacterium]MBA3048899.1 cytochrome-c oxidase, cbb3-type subunit III [Brevundimonas sp.]MBU3972906.1 cytochrome-c oxidase, cbb3-type subunit III [Alphaproteobacteria bacterium]MBU4038307.1 cytochrome-c oxidase, cbb3-type subunit III [Alphaproteobacteria bacterium]MBU4134894.1 cytochrome-c oxidase, cbb3-type subunit III [Alphaproteobacteria bacterium]